MISLNFDMGEIRELLNLEKQVHKAMDEAIKDLASQAHAHMIEEANVKLHSRRELFIDNLSFHEDSESAGEGVYIITLGAKARWIDDGIPEHNMLDDLLKSPKAKIAKDGSKYLVIPFKHGPGKGPTNATQANQDLTSTLKKEMKNRGIPFAKIEKDEHGQPKVGRLHSFSIKNGPNKTANVPGQGKGPIGTVRQGPTGLPLLSGVNVYQSPVKGADGVERIKRSIMTFRIASSNHKEQGGRWDHPGVEGAFLFEETMDWVTREWEAKIKPELLATLIAEIS
jgi:hypothetical protein